MNTQKYGKIIGYVALAVVIGAVVYKVSLVRKNAMQEITPVGTAIISATPTASTTVVDTETASTSTATSTK